MTNAIENNPPKWTRAIAWFTNPRVLNNDKKLRNAVNGKVVLITGASFGIGEATAQRMAAMGAIVVLVARSADKLEQVATAIRSTMPNITRHRIGCYAFVVVTKDKSTISKKVWLRLHPANEKLLLERSQRKNLTHRQNPLYRMLFFILTRRHIILTTKRLTKCRF